MSFGENKIIRIIKFCEILIMIVGAAGLVMAIVGGALMPPLQGAIIDQGTVAWLPAVNVSFVLPFVCFVVICVYGVRTNRRRILG